MIRFFNTSLQKTTFIIYILSLCPIIFYIFMIGVNNLSFYYMTVVNLFLGVLLFLFSNNTNKKFLVLPGIACLVFSVINILIIKIFNEKIAIICLLMSIFYFMQFYLERNYKIKSNKIL